MELKLNRGLLGLECNITDILNKYTTAKCTSAFYMYKYGNGNLLIRGLGATRGAIYYDENNTITDIIIADDLNYKGNTAAFNRADKESINKELSQFIGNTIIV